MQIGDKFKYEEVRIVTALLYVDKKGNPGQIRYRIDGEPAEKSTTADGRAFEHFPEYDKDAAVFLAEGKATK